MIFMKNGCRRLSLTKGFTSFYSVDLSIEMCSNLLQLKLYR